jgi:hypothetical protein
MNAFKQTIAIVDDAISQDYLINQLAFAVAIYDDGRCIDSSVTLPGGGVDPSGVAQIPSHGTLCAMVLEQFLPEARIGSIALENVSVDCIVNALYWCLHNGIKYIQISMGGVQPSEWEEAKLTKILEQLHESNSLVVAALANTIQYTVPACFPHVICVQAASEESKSEFEIIGNNLLEINCIGRGHHTLRHNRNSIHLRNSNSFAVPVAMVKAVENPTKISQYKLVYPFRFAEYIYIGLIKQPVALPSLVKVKNYIAYEEHPLFSKEEAYIFDSNLSANAEIVRRIIKTSENLNYCLFMGKISESIRAECVKRKVFYWERQNYEDALKSYLLGRHSHKWGRVDCPVVHLSSSSTLVNLEFAIEMKTYAAQKGYSCRIITTTKGLFLPGADYCEANQLDLLIPLISHFHGPSMIFVLGGEQVAKLSSFIDVHIRINNFSENLSVAGKTIYIPRMYTDKELTYFLNYLIRNYGE